MIAGAPELKNKVVISWYLLVAIVTLSITIGGTVTKVLDNDSQREEQKEYLLGEVEGLRADWERRNKDVEKRFDKLEKTIESLN